MYLACVHCLHRGLSCFTITETAFRPTHLFLPPFFLLFLLVCQSHQLKPDLVTHFLKSLYHLPSLILNSQNLKMTFVQNYLILFPLLCFNFGLCFLPSTHQGFAGLCCKHSALRHSYISFHSSFSSFLTGLSPGRPTNSS